MKKTFYFKFYLMLMLMLPMMLPLAVQARPDWASEYFENPSYFDAYAMGNGRIHVKVLIFAVGGLYDFNAGIGNPSDLGDGQAHYLFPSRVSYVVPTGSHRFIEYGADNHYNRPYTVAGRPLDMGWIRFRVTDGSIVVTNEYYGTNPSFTVNDGWIEVDLKRDATGDFLTYLEFDWYPSETLNGVEFDAVVTTVNHRSGEATPWNTREYNLGTFYGADMDQQPQLMDPVFYPVTSEGGPSIGNLTIPYVSFQQVYQYYTSWNSTSIPCTEQGGMLSVASADSVQYGFYITMQTKNSRSNADVVLKQWLRSNKVNIPAYHKIYDFTVGPYIWGGVPDNEVDPHVPCGTSEQCRYTLYLTDTWGDGWNAGGSLAVRQNGNLIATLVMDSGSLDSLVLYLCNNVEIQFTWFPGNFNYESGFYVVDHNGYTVFSKENLPDNIATYSFTPNCSSYLECNNYQNPRFKKLSWKIRLPYEEDIMVTDMFELQRAYDSSFADAQTIATIPMSWDVTDSLPALTYTYVDSSFADMNSTPVTGDSVYYRVRRASSSVWGWNHPYAGHGSSKMENRLVSIQASECKFSKDPDFDNNHKVNLTIALADVLSGSPRIRKSYWDNNATLYIKKVLVESGDTILIRVPTESITHAIDSAFFRPCDESSDGTITIRYTDLLNTPCNHVEYFYYIDTTGTSLRQTAADIENYGNVAQTRHFLRIGGHPYFTDAGNLNTLDATDGEYPDRVLITWTPTEGNVDDYTVETRPDTASEWTLLGTTTNTYWNDMMADPSVTPEWHYRVTMSYTCQGTTVSDSRTTTGSRSPWGRVSGRVHYEDGSGCPGITVVATRTSDGATVQTAVTDVTGHYMLDSLPYGGNVEYTITPTSQTAQFHYNNTSSGFATVNLSLASCVTTGIDFDNISSVRVTGRVLYENSSVPVHDAGFLLNGNPVSLSGSAVKTDVGGYFEIHAPEGSAFTLQVVKEGHHFASGGFVYINGDSLLTLDAALDGVRVWDQTKVHLAGRVAGGLDQRNLPLGFGLSTNNLGDDLRLVLELEGDNVSNIVLIPNDLTKDTLEFTVPHLVYGQDGVDTVGVTRVHYQQKRIIIEPDPVTGEFCADLFPVRYKLVQATATNYATLFTSGTTSQTLDLGFAAIVQDTIRYGSQYTVSDCQFKLTYRSPINITCQQMVYGMVMPYFGDRYMQRTNIRNEQIQVPLAYKDSTGVYQYLFGAPVFRSGEYSFRAYAHEDYYYNNEPSGRHDEVRIKGGTLKVYNGMHETPSHNTQILTMELDSIGQADFTIPVDYVSFIRSDSSVLRVLDLSVESEGAYVEKQAVRGYITGNRITGSEAITSTHGEVKLLDVLRDPPGSTSSAWLEAGTEYNYSYTYAIDFTFGVDIGFQTGTSLSMTIGAFLGLGSGMFSGQDFNVNQTFQFDIPISTVLHHKHQSSYTFKTSERISTSSDIHWVGQPADVYIGLVQNMYARRVDAVQPIDSLTYATLGAHSATGLMATVAEGVAPDSTRYYLVIGKELEMRPAITSTFAYTHKYIKNDLIPRLVQERDALLLTCDSATAQSIADARHKVVFRSLVPFGDENWAVENYYRAVLPQGFTDEYVNSVDSANRLIADWLTVMLRNEAEKVSAIHYHGHDSLATYSLGNATTVTRTENYSYSDATHTYMDYPGMDMSSLANNVIGVVASKFGQGIANVMDEAFSKTLQNSGGADNESPMTLAQQSPGSSTKFIFKPILDLDFSRDPVQKTIHTRALGFTLSPDTYSNMDVSIYRIVNSRDAYNSGSYDARDGVDGPTDYNINDFLYGSPVFYLRGGATKCPCELADSTEVYVPKMPISAGSLRLENPKVDINVHERSNVPVNSPAVFTLTLYNETEQVTSIDNLPINFKLKMNDQSNPHGAQVFIDGMPLTDGRIFEFFGDQVVTKTMEVYAGDGYDFEDLVIEFG
ncbi:MAG: carboxypeptidase-like regulatory domain-containing protein, partial [Bacteroidales bacterium]|nr:carboxypeptidase-like regulatory domain-containing protein [Bacteroidales bacterium]